MVTTPAQADPACQNYAFPDGDLAILQNDKWVVSIPASGQRLTGRVSASSPNSFGESDSQTISGSPSGGINGTAIDFTVAWDNGHRSHYFGTVMGDGHGAGERDDVRTAGAGPDNTTWNTESPLKCIPAAAPPAQPAPPKAANPAPPKAAEPDPAVPQQQGQRPDTDGDGLFDDDETDVYSTNPNTADTDGDGRNDGQEVFEETDPNNRFE
jgi:hypothetical protein